MSINDIENNSKNEVVNKTTKFKHVSGLIKIFFATIWIVMVLFCIMMMEKSNKYSNSSFNTQSKVDIMSLQMKEYMMNVVGNSTAFAKLIDWDFKVDKPLYIKNNVAILVARIKNMRVLDVKTKELGDVVDEDGFSVVLCVKNGINDINILKIGKSDTYDYDYTDDIELLKITCGMD